MNSQQYIYRLEDCTTIVMVRVTGATRQFSCRFRLQVCCIVTAICFLLLLSVMHIHKRVAISTTQVAASVGARETDGAFKFRPEVKANLSLSQTQYYYTRIKTFYLACAPMQRLGNQMFIFALAYGIARRWNRVLVTAKRSLLEEHFQMNITYANVTNWPHLHER